MPHLSDQTVNKLFTNYTKLLKRIKDLLCVFSSNLGVVALNVVLVACTVEVVDRCICCTVSLCEVVVEDCAGDLACDNLLNNFCQGVNAYQIDICANCAACGLDGLQSAKCHSVVVAENNFDVVAVLGKGVSYKLSALNLIPHTNLIIQAVNFETSVCQSLNGELCTISCVDVLGVAFDHDVVDLAVLVEVNSVKAKVSDDLALESTGLTCVTAYIADIPIVVCPSLLLISIGLTVDVNQRDAGCYDLIGNCSCGRGVNQVDDQNVNAVSDEVVDLAGLCSLVICAVNDCDVLFCEALLDEISLLRLCFRRSLPAWMLQGWKLS